MKDSTGFLTVSPWLSQQASTPSAHIFSHQPLPYSLASLLPNLLPLFPRKTFNFLSIFCQFSVNFPSIPSKAFTFQTVSKPHQFNFKAQRDSQKNFSPEAQLDKYLMGNREIKKRVIL
jgi:hypothetical protein